MLNKILNSKLQFKWHTVFISAFLCGALMGLVTTLSTVLSTATSLPILNKLLFAIAFTSLLFLTLVNGYELFTGNTMLLTLMNKKELRVKILANLGLVYSGNLLGCVVTALLIWAVRIDAIFNLEAVLLSAYNTKTSLAIHELLILGFFANYMVCMGVFLGAKGENMQEKYMGLFFPIILFVVLGFEHSVANMYTLNYAAMVLNKSVVPVVYNLFFVTIGNIIGGVAFAFSTMVKRVKPSQPDN